QAAGGEVLQARIQRSVAEGAERPENRVQPLAQLVAMHGGFVQQPEHGKLEHAGPLAHLGSRLLPCWALQHHHCICPMYRADTSTRYVVLGSSASSGFWAG